MAERNIAESGKQMTSEPSGEARIIASWEKNAAAWTGAVRGGQIESRKAVTDGAMVQAILSRSPRSVLDVGCGEGWLARELARSGVQVTGVDTVPELIEAATRAGGGDFRVMSYDEIAAGRLDVYADVVACNFSLLGKESVHGIFRTASSLLGPHGALIVQTLHPVMACGDLPYRDGWRDGSWAGFGAEFREPAPWYFRTLESWIRLFVDTGLGLREVREPLHPQSGKPASVIFVAEAGG